MSLNNNSLPRPLPNNGDPRYSRLQQDETLRRDRDVDSETMNARKKWNNSSFENEAKDSNIKSSLKLSTPKETNVSVNIYPPYEDEDECPTCLEEYTLENPKIIMKCSHHFHLGCIYEWMERSETCPVCGKVMAFDETM